MAAGDRGVGSGPRTDEADPTHFLMIGAADTDSPRKPAAAPQEREPALAPSPAPVRATRQRPSGAAQKAPVDDPEPFDDPLPF
jgi:hypothetical protein